MTAMDFTGTVLRNNLMTWAEKAGAHFHRSGREWRSHCPLHGGNNPDGFAVYESGGKQHWKCFTGDCGQGDVIDFIQAWQDCDAKTAYRILGGDEHPDPSQVARAAIEQAERAEKQLQEQIDRAQRAIDELRQIKSWLVYHSNLTEERRQLWQQRGVPPQWQDFWKLGYCEGFTVGTDAGPHITDTLTIPILDENLQVVNVRHRLLNPPRPNDKYRPDRPGLKSTPFLACAPYKYDANRVLVVEGEIKAMVVFSRLYRKNEDPFQVIGIPGKSQFRAITDRLIGHEVYICLDPDADQQAREFAGLVHGKVLRMPVKIDDAILAGDLDRRGLLFRMETARKA